jgi:hypothetical protein
VSGKQIVSAERLHLVRVHEPLRRKDRCHATVYSRQVPNTLTPSLGAVRYSLDGGATWTNIRSSADLWDASMTPDVVVLSDSQDFSLVRVEVSQAAPTQPYSTGVNIYDIFVTASLSS